MRQLRKFLREALLALPGSWFGTRLLPRLRLMYDRLPLYEWRTIRYCRSEARHLRRVLDRGADQFNLVFDSGTVLSYGALINMIMIARFLATSGGNVRFAVVVSSQQLEPENLSKVQIADRVDELVAIARVLLMSKGCSVHLIDEGALHGWLDEVPGAVTVFGDFTRNRRPFFRDCFNVFNVLMAELDEPEQDRVLFEPSEFEEVMPGSFVLDEVGPYVAWQCRYSERGIDFGRQTMADEFGRSYQRIKEQYPAHRVMIVSDNPGCIHYAKLAESLGIDGLLFTKDYSSDFLGDVSLLMNSDFVFFFRGGGIGLFAIHSRIPYEYFSPIMNDLMWNDEQFSSWQTHDQHFILLEKHQFVTDRSLDLEKIGFSSTGSN